MNQLTINCTKSGIRVTGANDIGSTSDAVVSSRKQFMRIAEHWWNTYCEGYKGDASEPQGEAVIGTAQLRNGIGRAIEIAKDSVNGGEYLGEGADPNFDRIIDALKGAIPACDFAERILNRVHDFLGKLCRDGKCGEYCSECLDASDLADDVWDVLHGKEGGAQ